MARTIPELRMRQFTDRRLSFLRYLLVLLGMTAIAIVGSALLAMSTAANVAMGMAMGVPTGPTMGPQFMFIMAPVAAIAIVAWWYQWQLFKRRNAHFTRVKRLKQRVALFLERELGLDVATLRRPDPLLERRERYRPPLLFLLWVIFSYIGWLAIIHWSVALLSLVGSVLGLIVYYWLTVDYYIHERGEIEYFGKLAGLLQQRDYEFRAEPMLYLGQRRFWLYILLSIVTFGIFTIYWMYVLFRDPNQHFDTHDFWEEQLDDILRRYRREREKEDT